MSVHPAHMTYDLRPSELPSSRPSVHMTYDLHDDLPRGEHKAGAGESPSASFTSTDVIRNNPALRFAIGKHFLGLIDADFEEEPLEDGRIDRFCVGGIPIGILTDMHVVTIAGSRSGKSRSCILNNLICYPGSILAVDPKSELASKTALHRARLFGGQNICVMDPFGIAKGGAENFRRSFNPLEHLDADKNLVEDAGLIADALVIPEESGKNSHWDESARHLIEGVILHVATSAQHKQEKNLATVYRLVVNINKDATIKTEMERNICADGAVKDAAAAFFEKPDDERERA